MGLYSYFYNRVLSFWVDRKPKSKNELALELAVENCFRMADEQLKQLNLPPDETKAVDVASRELSRAIVKASRKMQLKTERQSFECMRVALSLYEKSLKAGVETLDYLGTPVPKVPDHENPALPKVR